MKVSSSFPNRILPNSIHPEHLLSCSCQWRSGFRAKGSFIDVLLCLRRPSGRRFCLATRVQSSNKKASARGCTRRQPVAGFPRRVFLSNTQNVASMRCAASVIGRLADFLCLSLENTKGQQTTQPRRTDVLVKSQERALSRHSVFKPHAEQGPRLA